jgi:23S rRNA (cytidine2498-2'-O)-methyltransferase
VALTVYQAAPGFLAELLAELPPGSEVREPLVLVRGQAPAIAPAWAANVWLEPAFIPIDSIGDAAKKLKALQRNWALCPTLHHRRAALIADKLPKVSARPLVFGQPAPTSPLGAWTLWDERTLLASPRCASPFANGEIRFVEDREGPPSRAYLKLWEVFTRLGVTPQPGELCLDLGASPGGWTFVLASLGARVFAVDKAPLDPRLERLPNVETCQGSAFGLDPRHAGAVDWLFSDVICYPERLLAYVTRWLELGQCRNFVCTVKLQGPGIPEALAGFRAIPGSTLTHLCHNKHELTWVRLG